MKLTITKMDDASTIDVDVASELTARELMEELIECDFLESQGRDSRYELHLKRTESVIPPDTTLDSAGAQEGDVVSIEMRSIAA